MKKEKGIRAFETEAMGLKSIVSAYSPQEAKYVTERSANAVGYPVKYVDVKVRREPLFDSWASPQVSRRCWDRKILERMFRPLNISAIYGSFYATITDRFVLEVQGK